VYGAILATWVSRIPLIKQHLGLNAGQLGLALLASPLGLIGGMQVVPSIVQRCSSATTARWAMVLSSGSMVLLATARSLAALAALLVLFGANLGALDIAMNTQAVAIEREYGRPINSGFHGIYSIGVLVGSVLGSLAARFGADPLLHFAVAGACMSALGAVGGRFLLGRDAGVDAVRPAVQNADSPAHVTTGVNRFLLAMGLIALCSFFSEGAIENWSGVYLHEVRHASFRLASLGLGAFGAGMAAGRLLGDRVIARFGRPQTLWKSALLASIAMIAVLLAPSADAAIAGYVVVGLGIATIVPIAFTLTGNSGAVQPAAAIARVTTVGYAGLFFSPAIIGLVAHQVGLTASLAIPAVFTLLVLPLSQAARDR
jgi:predicted MFS family arabinose efflux permease